MPETRPSSPPLRPPLRAALAGGGLGAAAGAVLGAWVVGGGGWSIADALSFTLHAALGYGAVGLAVGFLLGLLPRRLRRPALAGVLVLAAAAFLQDRVPRPPAGSPGVSARSDLLEPTGLRVLVVAIDGAEWAVLDPLVASGRAPAFAALKEGGLHAPLRSLERTASPVVWTTVATGRPPERHGVGDFLSPTLRFDPPLRAPVNAPDPPLRRLLRPIPGTSIEALPVTSRTRRVSALWGQASAAGLPVLTVGWWGTWPAEPVRGVQVSDHVSYQRLNSRSSAREVAFGQVHPPELLDAVRAGVRAPEELDPAFVARFTAEPEEPAPFDEHDPVSELRVALAAMETYGGLAEARLRADRPALSMVYFQAVDIASHYFWRFSFAPGPEHPEPTARERARFGGTVQAVYEHQDRRLAALLEAFGGPAEDAVVIVLSDHGFGAAEEVQRRSPQVTGTHRRDGILLVAGGPTLPGAALAGPSVYDLAPTVLHLLGLPVGADMPGRVWTEGLDPAWLAAHPVRLVDGWDGPPGPVRPLPPSGSLDRDKIEQLRGLGYLD